ncbi:type VI secretion system ATPase TssH [Lysobacter yananisis]|uniref:Type VI secretion system ATPase TssH n=1 Tax=Lysobacter yananisis TaxID=1003114 RepID=A0ABY9P8E7_9GAMM|nr:type VI secretion system ATPase TssH [Lysobacter yananisis]WMT02127.1 type VI secretion system ATPase TssH [Lysobacter yananisis]
MANISRAALFGKLNKIAYQSIESATVFCKLRGNPEVELSHWLYQLLQLQDGDVHRIVRHFGIEPARLARDLTQALDRLPRSGGGAHFDLSAHVEETVERAWLYCSLRYGRQRVRSGDLLVAIAQTRGLRNALLALSPEFAALRTEALTDELERIVAGSPEDDALDVAATPAEAAPGQGAVAGGDDALARFTVDLTAQARAGSIDPVVGRDEEIRQLVDILMRRRQNNPMLVGEAGVGKTAVVEGFALRIAEGDVPPALREVELRVLDVGLLQAGASVKGEFENRLRQVIDRVQASVRPIVLFIDEAHTLVGAGGAAGTGDAANLLKPALARGNLRTIGATTWAEYKRHIEKDPALTRRFQPIKIEEPAEARAVAMMRGVAAAMEQHHRVQILDEALEAAVRLSHRYIPARQLPDKSVSLLDTACARVAISHHAVPPQLDDARKRIAVLETEQTMVEREGRIGVDVAERAGRVGTELADLRENEQRLQQGWAAEKALVERILALRARLGEAVAASEAGATAMAHAEPADDAAADEELADAETPIRGDGEAHAPADPGAPSLLDQLRALQAELSALQGERPLVLPSVDYQAVASVVADWTGIPLGRMARDEVRTVLELPALLGRRVVGQDHAMEAIARRIQTSRAGLDNPDKPVGVFLLAGTSGVGKTETALALAETLYGGEQNLITINMSEFQEPHSVATLKGAPPGYVGYGEGGVLTEAVRRRPYSVVLLDEVEKAHPDVHEIFFQVFDKGWMEDGEGRRIDFRNTLILLTTNAGTELLTSLCADPDLTPDPDALGQALRAPLLKVFPPALLGRLVTIAYYPLGDALLARIARLQLERIAQRVAARYRAQFRYGEDVIALVVQRCTESESGGRMIDSILTHALLPTISRRLLERDAELPPPRSIRIGADGAELSVEID